jgi:hypothetical protein
LKLIRELFGAVLLAPIFSMAFTGASANAGSPGYLYVADFDTTPTTAASLNLPVSAETVSSSSEEHSLFEMSMSNEGGSSGNIIEIGITTDRGLNGDPNPHWFVSSWVGGTWKGYDGASDFVSDDGNFWSSALTSEEGTSETAGFEYNDGEWQLYLNSVLAGYFPGSEWGGAFTQSSVTEVFGEVYWNGTFYPTLNGTISGYDSSCGGTLSTLVVDAPYAQSNTSTTGFTASGPVPEPSALVLVSTCAIGLGLRRGKALF